MYNVIKYLFGSILAITGLLILLLASFMTGFYVFLAGVCIIPYFSNKIEEKYSFWNYKVIRRVTPISFLFVAIISLGDSNHENNKKDSKKKILIDHIKNNTADKSIKLLQDLEDIEDLFGDKNHSTVQIAHNYIEENYDSLRNVTILTFDPRFRFHKNQFLKPNKDGIIQDYILKFEIDENDSIISNETIITYSKSGTKEYSNMELPDLKTLIDKTVIKKQKKVVELERLTAKRQREIARKMKNFEENCISSWDGSHYTLERYLLNRMNDPDSYEHVETSYSLYDDHAIVVMQFRGRNSFGGTVLNSVKAKTSLENCSIINIDYVIK